MMSMERGMHVLGSFDLLGSTLFRDVGYTKIRPVGYNASVGSQLKEY